MALRRYCARCYAQLSESETDVLCERCRTREPYTPLSPIKTPPDWEDVVCAVLTGIIVIFGVIFMASALIVTLSAI